MKNDHVTAMLPEEKSPVLLFADRLPPLTGGMEMHARYFIEHFADHPRFPLVGVVTRCQDADCLLEDGAPKPLRIEDLRCCLSRRPTIVFFNSGRWIEDLARVRRQLPASLLVYRTGGNEILKAPLDRANISSHAERQAFWVRTLVKNIDFLVTNSVFTEERLAAIGLPRALFARCVGGVNAEAIRSSLTRGRDHREPPIFVSVARFVPYKNHGLMVDVFASLMRRGHAFRLRFVGDGPLLSEVANRVTRLGLEKMVEFLGLLSNEDACCEIATADFYVQLSSDEPTVVPGGSYLHSEGMGRAVLEALTAGTTVIAARSGALPEVITPDRGVLVDHRSSEDVVDVIASLLRARRARAPFSDAYAWPRYFELYERLWEERCVR